MSIPLWLLFCGIFLLFVLVDIVGHKVLKIGRTWAHWCLFIALIGAMGLSGFLGLRSTLRSKSENDLNLYLAYRYLQTGDGLNASKKADLCAGDAKGHDQVVALLSDAVQGDYIAAYFAATQIMENQQVDQSLMGSVEAVRNIASDILGISEGEGAKSELPLVGISLESDDTAAAEAITDEEALLEIGQEVDACFEALGFSEEQKLHYHSVYELDRMINSSELSQLDSASVDGMIESYPKDSDILRLGAKYYMYSKQYDKARDCAYRLLREERCAENYVVFTDVIAQTAAERGLTAEQMDDEEVKSLFKKAESLEERAAEYEAFGDFETDKRDELLNEAQDLRDQAARLDISRAVNYLLAKKPLLGDDTGLFDIQLAKLYIALDDRDMARSYIHKVIDRNDVIRDDSPIKKPLLDVVDAYNQLGQDETSPLLSSSVNKLVVAESQGVITVAEGNINGELSNYITSTLKYDRIFVHIGKIDTSQYPTIRAYANVNGTKEKMFGLVSDFSEKDFELIDTQYQIQDFSLVSSEKDRQIAIAIVMDKSGSMSGTPINDAKLAAEECINNMDTTSQKIAIVSYDDGATVDVPLTSSTAKLTSGVRDIRDGGGTNISGGIQAGIETLANASGTRAIILLTDGQDGNSEEAMNAAIDRAKQEDVVIFAVGFGDINSEYMRNIAESTGGKFIYADNSTELSDIYRTLQKYIVNNYCFEYTVTQNPETDPRTLILSIPTYQTSASKTYRISGDPVDETELEEGIELAESGELAVFSVAPGGVSAQELQRGVKVVVKGAGFVEGLHISVGDLVVDNLRILDANTAEGTITGSLSVGRYPVRVTLPDGRVDMKTDAFRVFRAGVSKSVRLGTVTILADTIGQVEDNTFVASGNVSINGFIHSDGDLNIVTDSLPDNFDINSGNSPYLGENGTLEGNGKLYISYQQAKAVGESGGNLQKLASNTFAELVMNGKDYIVRNGRFSMDVNGTETEFTDTVYDFDVKIPNMAKIEVAKCTLYADRLQVDASTLDVGDIVDTVKQALSGGASAPSEAEKPYTSKKKAFGFKGIEGKLSMALSADDIRVGGEVKLKINDAIQFGFFGIRDFSIKFNTLDADQEYWKVGGSIDFSHIVPGLGGAGVEGFEASLGSYYWYPDTVVFNANLNPGIPIYKVIYIDKIGGKAEGLSTLIMWAQGLSPQMQKVLGTDISLDEVSKKDVILAGLLEADVNLFKSLNLPASEEISRWGELGAIQDGEIGFNCSQLEFYAKADLAIFQQKVANAEISLGKPGFRIEGGVNLDVSAFGLSLAGGVDLGAKATASSSSIWFAGDAHLSCSWTHTNWDGDVKAEFNIEKNEYNETRLIEVVLRKGDQYARYWYDKDSGVTLFGRVHQEVNF